MDNGILSELSGSVMEKIEVRARRVGIPERGYMTDVTEPGRSSSLFICGNEGDARTEILRLSVGEDCSCSVSVREDSFSCKGAPGGYSTEVTAADGWHIFSYRQFNEEAARYISLYSADIIEFEFSIFETDAEPFDCCSRQYTCSIRGECLHPDQLYAKACIYRKTLLTGNKY